MKRKKQTLEGIERDGGWMKLCKNIIDGVRCPNAVTGKFKHCAGCRKLRQNIAGNKSYHKKKIRWRPREIPCRYCGEIVHITDKTQVGRKYCDNGGVCQKLYHKSTKTDKPYKKHKAEVNKSPNKRTKCICPTCGETHSLSLNLHPDERKKTDAGILYRRRCKPCKALVDRDGISSVAGAHNVGH